MIVCMARESEIRKQLFLVKQALLVHPSTGRLWATQIQLLSTKDGKEGSASAFAIFDEALQHVPKSGEVWCEGARLALAKGDYQVL